MEKRPAFARIICPSFQTIRFTGEGGSGFFQQGLYKDLYGDVPLAAVASPEGAWWQLSVGLGVCWAGRVVARPPPGLGLPSGKVPQAQGPPVALR